MATTLFHILLWWCALAIPTGILLGQCIARGNAESGDPPSRPGDDHPLITHPIEAPEIP